MTAKTHSKPVARGFALVVTLSLMILLTVIAVGLLSLSAVSLRSSSTGEADARAYANARMAVILAIGELQREAGDDRRITADASILLPDAIPPAGGQSKPQPQRHLVGVWSSWSPGLIANPGQSAPDYKTPKTNLFRSWLVSTPDPAVTRNRDWATTVVDPEDPKRVRLFSLGKDGFDLSAAPVPTPRGSIAWVVSQENTKAKVNVAGPEADAAANLALQAQRRPSLASSGVLKQPASGWNLRADRLLSFKQIGLDAEIATDAAAIPAAGASFTVHSQGLLTDVVRGGLKTDLNLGFELSDADFTQAAWDGVPNPFRSPGGAGFSSPASFKGQRALFAPLVENPIVSTTVKYDAFDLQNRFYGASVPTFDHLRSFYRIPHHLYGGSPPTVAERGPDHIAVKLPGGGGGKTYFSDANPPQGEGSSLAIRPVLNRLVYLLSVGLTNQKGELGLVLTPIVSLWNPYNTALEIEGAVAYPWMDMPFNLNWKVVAANGGQSKWPTVYMSMMMAKQFESKNHGRSVNPYFLCEITAEGDGAMSKPIRFEPGEVRVFAPVSNVPVDFNRKGTNQQRTVRLRPVENSNQLNLRGGFTVPMTNGVKTQEGQTGLPISYKVKGTDKIFLQLVASQPNATVDVEGYHYFVSLEDAGRIKSGNSDAARGEAVNEVQVLGFQSNITVVNAPTINGSDLSIRPLPFAVMETFHRTALASGANRPNADLVYTTNPRQTWINRDLSSGSFDVAPHFRSTLVGTADFSGAIETSFDGRRSFWGSSHSSAAGKDYLPFFEIPREPLLSLAAFQHADLSASTYSSANQFANSWASPYLALGKTAAITKKYASNGVPVYDTPFLVNEALWDSFFFSGAAPVLKPAASGKPATAWDSPIAVVTRSLDQVVGDFVADPSGKPLANSRMRLSKGRLADEVLVKRLLDPAGCARIAAHLTVDGAFNINSTDVEAWIALLSGLRGEAFEVEGGTAPSGDLTALPRFRHPTGKTDDNWNGFRALSDAQIRTLATNLVAEIRSRGPFLSLAEFVNRRVEDSALGRSGAIQAAIDTSSVNAQAKQSPFDEGKYPDEARDHIIKDTGVGIPGYLTQADVLQSLAPVITSRSDTFTIRGYGEAKDQAGKVIARSWCEAVVQRTPEFVDPSNAADAAISSLTAVNSTFGRRFEIVSFRRISNAEIQ